jgi:hypothetical protein
MKILTLPRRTCADPRRPAEGAWRSVWRSKALMCVLPMYAAISAC